MKVEKINQNYSVKQGRRNSVQSASIPHFTGNVLNEQIRNQLPNKAAIKIMEKLKWLKGELGGILITAIGTGAVAPIFIAYNPFVKAPENATEEQKEDVKNTKKYTAWRQPVSAVLAVAFQTSVLTPIDRGLETLFNNERFAKNLWLGLDQSTLNHKDFLERKVKKEMRNEKLKFNSHDDYKRELDSRVDAIETKQIEENAEKLKEKGRIVIGQRMVDNNTTAELINKAIDDYIKDATNLKTSEAGLNFYTQRATILVNNEKELTKILKDNLPEDNKQLLNYLKEESKKAKNQDIKTILDEIINYPENLRLSRCQRTLQRIETIKSICEGQFSPEKYLEKMEETNKNLDDIIKKLEKSKLTNSQNISETEIKNIVDKIAGYCTFDENNYRLKNKFLNTATFQSDKNELINKIYKDIIKGYKKFLEDRYKGFNQLSKIAIGLCITLPITCTALNWVYPRFMELCFPKLSGKKKDDAQKVKNGGEN